MTLRCEILTLKTSDSFFRSFCFLRQNEALSATEQNQTYKNSLFLETSMQFSNRIKCDVGANKNAGQAFSMQRLSSHFILYQISAFRFFSPLNIINHRFLLFKHHIMAESRSMKNNRHLVKLPCHMLRFMGIASNRDKFAAKFAVSS